MTAPIVINHLTKHFGRVKAVSDLSFEVNGAEIAGFLGPNGAGKTTTMRLLLGFHQPHLRTLRGPGRVPAKAAPAKTAGRLPAR